MSEGDPGPWDGMSYEGLAGLARKALVEAMGEAPGSVGRALKMAAYDAVVNEFKRRVIEYAAIKFDLPPVAVSSEALAGWKLILGDAGDITL